MSSKSILICAAVLLLIAAVGNTAAQSENALSNNKERLGKLIFEDARLSTPEGQSCADCHARKVGFADPDKSRAVSAGIVPGRFGNRNAPSAAYAAFSPEFFFDPHPPDHPSQGEFYGGQFWDGRAPTLVEQAKGPFLNPLEMNNKDKAAVIKKIKAGKYADLFERVYGAGALNNVETAYNQVADAIAAYEKTNKVNKFTSKFDAYKAGMVSLTADEEAGLELFSGKAKCDKCHPDSPDRFSVGLAEGKALFTEEDYENDGIPSNLGMLGNSDALRFWYPFYYETAFNPAGLKFVDKGLGDILKNSPNKEWRAMAEENMGKFKTPTLRNIALTSPYFHNGALKTLEQAVHFFNTRDTLGNCAKKTKPQPGVNCWPVPEVRQNMNTEDLGNLGLTPKEEAAIVAFLKTLTDGYKVPEKEHNAKPDLHQPIAVLEKMIAHIGDIDILEELLDREKEGDNRVELKEIIEKRIDDIERNE